MDRSVNDKDVDSYLCAKGGRGRGRSHVWEEGGEGVARGADGT